MTRLTRREALLAGAALVVTGCAGETTQQTGSTLQRTWGDPGGSGVLSRFGGEALRARTELGPASEGTRVLGTLAHVSDAHVLDASSPARVTFLDRLGDPFQSTFRPQETLTTQVLTGAVNAVRHLRPDAVIQGGDLIDNDQANELSAALAVLKGGRVSPGSGPHGYYGVQLAGNPDPFYYRPDLDAPRHPGLLRRAMRPFTSGGVKRIPVYPVLGDHDILVAGEIPPDRATRSLALGAEALWEMPPGLTLPPGARLAESVSPDGPPDPGLINEFLAQALAAPKVRVPVDPARAQMSATEVTQRLGSANSRLDYHVDIGQHVRLIVLDLARREGGSGGLVVAGQLPWIERRVAEAKSRWVIIVSHQPLASSEGGEQLLAVLDQSPRVIAALSGHTHRNRIEPRPTSAGGYWLISTASLIDYPQQARALRIVATRDGGVAIQTWMLDHAFPGDLGTISRQLAYLDAQGGRPRSFAGRREDRNALLFRSGASGA